LQPSKKGAQNDVFKMKKGHFGNKNGNKGRKKRAKAKNAGGKPIVQLSPRYKKCFATVGYAAQLGRCRGQQMKQSKTRKSTDKKT